MWWTTEEVRQCELLEWLSTHEGVATVSVRYDELGLPFDILRDDIRALEYAGLVKPLFLGGMRVDAEVTSEGRSHVERIHAQRADRSGRRKACRIAILKWLDDSTDGDAFNSISGFNDSRYDLYVGQRFTDGDVTHALDYLLDQNFIEGVTTEETGVVQAKLASKGYEAVDDFDADPSRMGTASAPQLNVSGHYVQVNTGAAAQQVMNVGFELEQLTRALVGLVEFARDSGVLPAADIELDELCSEAADETRTSGRPSGKYLKVLERVRTAAHGSGDTAKVAAITALINALASDLNHLAGLAH